MSDKDIVREARLWATERMRTVHGMGAEGDLLREYMCPAVLLEALANEIERLRKELEP